MALNLSPEKGVKLTKKDRAHVLTKMKQGWKANCLIPDYIFDELNKEFNFNLDVCATDHNHKCDQYFTKEIDGLSQDWKGVCWMNPPYGRTINQWLKKAAISARGGAIVVCLIPARTDTRWWKDYVLCASELRFITGRVKFGKSKVGAPFPSVIAIFGTPTTPRIKQVDFKN